MKKNIFFFAAGIVVAVIAFYFYNLLQQKRNTKHYVEVAPGNQGLPYSQSNLSKRTASQITADEQKAILAKVAEGQARFAEQLKNAAKEPWPLVSFSETGKLTTDAISRLKLTDDQVVKIEAALTDLKKSCQEDFVSRTKLTDTVQNDNGTTYYYYTRAREDRGKLYEDNFRQNINTTLSKEDTTLLFSGFDSDRVTNAQMGDCDMEFQIGRGNDGKYSTISYKYINPNNGSVFREGSSDLSTFSRKFGSVFDLQN